MKDFLLSLLNLGVFILISYIIYLFIGHLLTMTTNTIYVFVILFVFIVVYLFLDK